MIFIVNLYNEVNQCYLKSVHQTSADFSYPYNKNRGTSALNHQIRTTRFLSVYSGALILLVNLPRTKVTSVQTNFTNLYVKLQVLYLSVHQTFLLKITFPYTKLFGNAIFVRGTTKKNFLEILELFDYFYCICQYNISS